MTVFSCADDFSAMMTCIYEAWSSRLGHDNVKLVREPIHQLELFTDYVHVEADSEKTESVVRSINQKISKGAYMWTFYASLSHEEDALDTIYRFLVLGFRYGACICQMLQNPVVMRMMELRRNVGNEAHLFVEFSRFTSINNGIYVSHIEPKNNCLISVANHFADRMISEYWIIMDDNRNLAAVHLPNEEFYIRNLTEDEATQLKMTEQFRDGFVAMWEEYFNTIAIKQRVNPVCQRNHFPEWMRKHAVEFLQSK